MNNDFLSRDEIELLTPILERLSRAAKFTITLKYLIDHWKIFVISVEQEYDDSIYEYLNDLSLREDLQIILDNVPQELRTKIAKCIGEWDITFKDATLVTSIPLQSGTTNHWWWYRVPKKPGASLKQDLENLRSKEG